MSSDGCPGYGEPLNRGWVCFSFAVKQLPVEAMDPAGTASQAFDMDACLGYGYILLFPWDSPGRRQASKWFRFRIQGLVHRGYFAMARSAPVVQSHCICQLQIFSLVHVTRVFRLGIPV